MSLESKMEKFSPLVHEDDDPRQRCVALIDGETRRCVYYAMKGINKCPMHGGLEFDQQRAKTNRSYKLAVWNSEMKRIGESDSLKSLRDEIVIARMTLQGILAQCQDNFDLMMNANKIAMMLEKINALVVNCNKLEDRLGLVLDKSAILNLAEQIVQIVGEHVPEHIQAEIADQIAAAVESSGPIPIKTLS